MEDPEWAEWIRQSRRLQTDQEWKSWDHPDPMTRLLEGKVTDRKARLFDSACFRRVWAWSGLEPHRWAIEVLEKQAEDLATPEETRTAALALRKAREWAAEAMGGMWCQCYLPMEDRDSGAWSIALLTCETMSVVSGMLIQETAGLIFDRPTVEQRKPEQRIQCHLLRCIFNSPFQQLPIIQPAWLTWRDGLIPQLAQAIYDERQLPEGTLDPTRLAVLADALEESGCTEEGILAHSRSPGPHVRGCWVVDCLLRRS